MKDSKNNKKDEFMAMAKKMGLSVREMREMLGLTNPDKEGVRKHAKGGVVKTEMKGSGMAGKTKMAKKMMRGGVMKKKMRGGGMMKVAKKKMMRGGMTMPKKKK
jgi:hypothetical protein